MGVVVRMDAYVPDTVNPARAFRAAFDRVAELDRRLSDYRQDSELRMVERQAWRSPVRISEDLFRVLEAALRLARDSGGAFDPTIGPVTRLLRSPSADEESEFESRVARAWATTGWTQVELDSTDRTVSIGRRGIQFDLGGIAKGYAADRALETLADAGVRKALVAVAGDIAAGEPPPGQTGWQVGVDAAGAPGTTERMLRLRNQAVSTSGSRERFHEQDGRKCSHILSRASSPCPPPGPAVSVVAPSGLEADGVATALMALGRERSDLLLRGRRGVRAYWAENPPAVGPPPDDSRDRR